MSINDPQFHPTAPDISGADWSIKIAGFDIAMEKLGPDRYRVTYGHEVGEGNYAGASDRLGQVIFHALSCKGLT